MNKSSSIWTLKEYLLLGLQCWKCCQYKINLESPFLLLMVFSCILSYPSFWASSHSSFAMISWIGFLILFDCRTKISSSIWRLLILISLPSSIRRNTILEKHKLQHEYKTHERTPQAPQKRQLYKKKVQQYLPRIDDKPNSNSTEGNKVHPINLESIFSSRDIST